MIYTVTLNPALDYRIDVDRLRLGETNRAKYEQLLPGGKGLNVSAVLTNLGIDNVALGFIAGFVGEEIKNKFEADGCKCDFVRLQSGNSRINVKIKSDEETEINASGPEIGAEAIAELTEKLDGICDGDVLVLAGSIPAALPPTFYADIMKRLSGKKIKLVADASGELLTNVLQYNPYLVKPNKSELSEIFGAKIESREEIIKYARRLSAMGAANVLVSLGGDGAVLVTESGKVLMCDAPKGELIDSVGAGDSMVAGFIAGGDDSEKALRLGIAAGSATAFSNRLATEDEICELYKKIKIKY